MRAVRGIALFFISPMPLLKDRDRQALTEQFAEMTAPVRIVFFTRADECETCSITEQILDEVAPLGDKLELVKLDYATDPAAAARYAIARVPAFAVVRLEEGRGENGGPAFLERDYGIRFYGVPSGYEFMSFIGALLDVSTGDSQLSPASRQLVSHITTPTHFQVFTTPT